MFKANALEVFPKLNKVRIFGKPPVFFQGGERGLSDSEYVNLNAIYGGKVIEGIIFPDNISRINRGEIKIDVNTNAIALMHAFKPGTVFGEQPVLLLDKVKIIGGT